LPGGAPNEADAPALVDLTWVRGVLFDRRIDRWADLAPDPLTALQISRVFAEQYEWTYQSWRWLSGLTGADADVPPAVSPSEPPSPSGLVLTTETWSELVSMLAVFPRVQHLVLERLLAGAGSSTQRNLGRYRDRLRAHASLGYLLLARNRDLDPPEVKARLEALCLAIDPWLAAIDPGLRMAWKTRTEMLLSSIDREVSSAER
jgi:hypothetical protein